MLVKPPEITTFRPAVEGSGEDAIDRPPDGQTAVQHVVPDAQQLVPDGQQVVPAAQHAVPDCGQHGTYLAPARALADVGRGQHGITVGCPCCCGHRVRGTLPVAPAGPGADITNRDAARARSDDREIRRRIAESGTQVPGFVKPNALPCVRRVSDRAPGGSDTERFGYPRKRLRRGLGVGRHAEMGPLATLPVVQAEIERLARNAARIGKIGRPAVE